MKTIPLNTLTPADRIDCIATSVANGQITLWYKGDTRPENPGPTPQEIAAAEALEAKLQADSEAARQYTKLRNLTALSPAEVQTWVAANVNTLADAKDAITTLAVAISVLGRPLAGGAVPRSGPPELAAKAAPPTMWQRTVKGTKSLLRMK